MKALFALLLVSTLISPAALVAASFEGKVTFKMTSGRGEPQQVRYNIKGDKIRVELPGQQAMGGMILDMAKKESTMIMDEQKMYMTMAIPDAAPATVRNDEKSDDVKLEKTGETEKILGHTATKYLATSDDTTTELWLAEGLGAFASFRSSNPMGGRRAARPQDWERALAGKDLFPLRVVGKDKKGKESFRMEATAIDRENLPDSLFVPPPGYQKLDMGGMMKGMMKGLIPGGGR